jgi:DNA helicase-2/ATP-dependent DNA helicase PcrA
MMMTDKMLASIMFGDDGSGKSWSQEQWDAITAPFAPHLVVAGAGSGKTTVMAARIVWLVAQDLVDPSAVLGLTFTNKAAREFNERVERALRRLGSGSASADSFEALPLISTYHSFAQTLLGTHGLRLGYEPGAELLNEVTRAQMAMRVVAQTRLPLQHVSDRLIDVAGQVMSVDDLLAERLIDPVQLRESAEDEIERASTSTRSNDVLRKIIIACQRRIELAQLVQEFRQAKADAFVADFADQMRAAADAARRLRAGDAAAIENIRGQFQAVLLDEYQDTSVAQRVMLQSLFGDGHPVMAVGDPCQAIYGWRGASVFNMDHFVDDFAVAPGTPATKSDLTYVRRCAPEILQVANAVSAEIRSAHPIVQELRTPEGDARQGRFVIAFHEEYDSETEWLVDQAKAALRDAAPEDIAVLCRKNRDVARMAAAFDSAGIAYQVNSVGSLLARPEVADVRAVLQLLHDPAANVACLRVLTSPRWALGVRDLAALGAHAAKLSGFTLPETGATLDERLDEAVQGRDEADLSALIEAVDDVALNRDALAGQLSDEARLRCKELSTEIRRLRAHVGEPLHDLIRRVIDTCGIGVEVLLAPEPLRSTKVTALDAFVDAAGDFLSLDGEASLASFLAWLSDAENTQREPRLPDLGLGAGIRLMTVHGSKGLEFDVVLLPSLSDGVFPTTQMRPMWPSSPVGLPSSLMEEREEAHKSAWYPNYATGPDDKQKTQYRDEMRALHILEERRLAYVAITRARSLVIASGHIWGSMAKTARTPSPWLLTMQQHINAGAPGVIDTWADAPADPKRDVDESIGAAAWPVIMSEVQRARLLSAIAAVRNAERDKALEDLASESDSDADDEVSVLHGGERLGGLSEGERELVERWDRDIAVLESESAEDSALVRYVRLPASITTTDVMRIAENREAFAIDLARPMPRISSVAARRGTDFHAWVEQRWRGDLGLVSPADAESVDPTWRPDPDLAALMESFDNGPFGNRPPFAVEVPFSTVIDGVPVRGRIDAVFALDDGTWEVIDWKTSVKENAEENQLRVYRKAWAEIREVDQSIVSAGFHYVRTGATIMLDDPAADLSGLLRGQ